MEGLNFLKNGVDFSGIYLDPKGFYHLYNFEDAPKAGEVLYFDLCGFSGHTYVVGRVIRSFKKSIVIAYDYLDL